MDAVNAVVDGVKKVTVGEGGQKKQQQLQGKSKKAKGPAGEAANANGPLELTPPASFLQDRLKLYDTLKAQHDEEISKMPKQPITITLGDGKIVAGNSWETSPASIARQISKSLLERTIIAKVDGELWDLDRPLEKDCRVELLDFDHPQGKEVFWHSSAHCMGEAAERRYGCSLCLGPPTDRGFFYEMSLLDGEVISQADWKPLETIVGSVIKEKQVFERLVISKDNLVKMFAYNKYKLHFINQFVEDGESTTIYRNGPFIDLCRGPHIRNSGSIKAFQIMKNSSSYWLGKAENESLQRIYGVSFPDKKLMDEHKKRLEEAARRDHRRLGKEQELFFFHDLSPGSCFFLPHGTRIYNSLMAFLRSEYWKRGYEEVITPNMYNSKLWQTSGHWQNYKDNMFTFDVEKDQFGLKPMNCPGHCLLFGHRERSYRELPWRVADFGVLHRNEFSGALTGLTRVRRFQQDDTHIFCTDEQIESEIGGLFDFLKTVYGTFGFKFKLVLSTRPEKYVGDIETWNVAEKKLETALNTFTAAGGSPWELNPGDGAFYGPKIDISISDALDRDYQCATIQLDFQLPQRFKLEYMTAEKSDKPKEDSGAKEHSQKVTMPIPAETTPTAQGPTTEGRDILPPGYARPVMIHRAIYGSLERFIAILTEHFGGKWPFWMSPRQLMVIPVMVSAGEYALEVQRLFRAKEFHTDVDVSGNTLQKKIRTAQLLQYNFIFGESSLTVEWIIHLLADTVNFAADRSWFS